MLRESYLQFVQWRCIFFAINFSQSARPSLVIVCFHPLECASPSWLNYPSSLCETTLRSAVFGVLTARPWCPRKVHLILSFSETSPWRVHFPPMKEPCIWEIYTLSLHCLAFYSNLGIFWSKLLVIPTCKLRERETFGPYHKLWTGKLTNQSSHTMSAI